MIDDLRWKLRWMIPRALFWGSGFLRCRLIRRRPETAYLERYWLGALFGWTFYLHRFVAPDREEEPHDHPWPSAVSLVLCGWYREGRWASADALRIGDGASRVLRAGRVNRLRKHEIHQILDARAETWTLFVHRKRLGEWGFYRREAGGVFYHQPHDTATTSAWQQSAPIGREMWRSVFGGWE